MLPVWPRLIELPIRALGHSRRKVSLLCYVLVITGAIRLLTCREGEVPSGYPLLIRQLTNVGFSIRHEAREERCFMSSERDELKFVAERFERDVRPFARGGYAEPR